jgi:uncharacterized integral membrane protein
MRRMIGERRCATIAGDRTTAHLEADVDRDDDGPRRDDVARAGDEHEETWTVRRSGPSPRLLIALVLVIVLVAFAAFNFRPVRVNFLLFSTRARVVTVIVLAALLGFVVGYFVGRPGREARRHLREWRSAPRGDADDR